MVRMRMHDTPRSRAYRVADLHRDILRIVGLAGSVDRPGSCRGAMRPASIQVLVAVVCAGSACAMPPLGDVANGPFDGSTLDAARDVGVWPDLAVLEATLPLDVMCRPPTVACGAECIDLSTDARHCGLCGRVCPTALPNAAFRGCLDGVCSYRCAAGTGDCDGNPLLRGCESLLDTHAHCGACGRSCGDVERCVGGTCRCEAPGAICDGSCRDLQTDHEHCGSCGSPCPAGHPCRAGACSPCLDGQIECDGACVDPRTNRLHCARCGHVCGPEETCTAGGCATCYGTLCSGRCTNPMSDPENCGACGRACAGDTGCVDGTCQRCVDGLAACRGRCVDLRYDAADCGACGRACPANEYCVEGVCRCDGYLTRCATICGRPDIDAANCGGCSVRCARDEECRFGRCVQCTVPATRCVDGCVNTSNNFRNCGSCDVRCLSYETCVAGRCNCAAPAQLCGGRCIPTDSDRRNCGTCGNACDATEGCISGRCAPCPFGQTLCAGRCVSLDSSTSHCGACLSQCGTDQVCAGGRCVCRTGAVACGRECVELVTSTTHCGSCGHACAVDETCEAGVCSRCEPPRVRCGGSCVDLSASVRHCGHCDFACAATAVCVAGTCREGVAPPANDACESATTIVLGPRTVTVRGSTSGADSSLVSCGTGSDVFYRFTVSRRTLVFAHTFGSSFETRVGWLANCATTPTCTSGQCGTRQSATVRMFEPGTYELVVDGAGGEHGDFLLSIQQLQIASASLFAVAPGDDLSARSISFPTATDTMGSCDVSPDVELLWVTCPGFLGATSTFSTCRVGAANFDAVLSLHHSNAASTPCAARTCALQASITGLIPPGAGLHALLVDGAAVASPTLRIDGIIPR